MSDDFRTPLGDSTPGPPDATLRALDVGQLIAGRFRLVRPLGKGGMGVVWLAKDESLGDEVAFKFLSEIIAHDEASLHDLKRELRRTRQLTHHHIIRVHDLVEDPARGVAGITMEVAAGGSLAARRAKTEHGWFEPEEIREWTRQLCDALDYAHRTARVVHRDLKPANLLLDAHGGLKIADFGISAALHESATRLTAGKVSGTPLYMSPEQWQGFPPAPSDDLYALGATLYELLTGKPPFYSGNVAAAALSLPPTSLTERRRELESLDAPVPAEWEQVVAALLAKTAEQRLPSAGEVLASLERKAPRPEPPPAPKPRPVPAPSPTPAPPVADDQTLKGTLPAPPIPSDDSSGWPWLRPILSRRWLAVLVWSAGSGLMWMALGWICGFRAPFLPPKPDTHIAAAASDAGGLLNTWKVGDALTIASLASGFTISWLPILLLRPRWWGALGWLAASVGWMQFFAERLWSIPTHWRRGDFFDPSNRAGLLSLGLVLALLVSTIQGAALWKVRTRWRIPAAVTAAILLLQLIIEAIPLNFVFLQRLDSWVLWSTSQAIGSAAIATAWFYGTRPHRPNASTTAQKA